MTSMSIGFKPYDDMIVVAEKYIAFIDEHRDVYVYSDNGSSKICPHARMIKASNHTLYVITEDDRLIIYHDPLLTTEPYHVIEDTKLVAAMADLAYGYVDTNNIVFVAYEREDMMLANEASNITILEASLSKLTNIRNKYDVYDNFTVYYLNENNELVIYSSKKFWAGKGINSTNEIEGEFISDGIHKFTFLTDIVLGIVPDVDDIGTIYVLTRQSLYNFTLSRTFRIKNFPQKILSGTTFAGIATGSRQPYILTDDMHLFLHGKKIENVPEGLLALHFDSYYPSLTMRPYLALGKSGALYRFILTDTAVHKLEQVII